IKSKTSTDWAYDWIFDPKHFRPSTRMPRFFGQTNNPRESDRVREQVEVNAMVAYLWANSEDPGYTRGPEGNAANGRELVESIGCTGCHRIEDAPKADGRTVLERIAGTAGRNHGPELSRMGGKTNHAWLENWLKDPQHYSPGTRMPAMRVTAQEAADIAAHLMQQGADWTAPPKPAVDEQVVRDLLVEKLEEKQQHQFAVNAVEAMTAEERLLEVGKQAIRRYGCAGCHDVPGFDGEPKIGTDMYEEGSKPLDKLDFGLLGKGHGWKDIDPNQTDHGVARPDVVDHTMHEWFERKLLNPRVYDWGKEKLPKDRLRMPNFEMDREEAEALVTFLLGMVKDPMPMSRHAHAQNDRYTSEQRGWKFLREFNCAGCHRLEDATLTFWLKGVDENGKHTGKPEEVTLRGRPGEWETDDETGKRSLRFQLGSYNAALPSKAPSQNWVVEEADIIRQRAHLGEAIAPSYFEYLNALQKKNRKPAFRDLSDIKPQLPPPLTGEGHKVQPPWVFKFLKEVEVLRPWLKLRMPSFTMRDGEAEAIAGYFGAKAYGEEQPRLDTVEASLKKQLSKAERLGEAELLAELKALEAALGVDRALYANPFPFEKYEERTAPYLAARNAEHENYLRRALEIMRDPGVDCFKCHIVRGKSPSDPDPANWAPDLARVRDRLRPQWVVKWLRNPQHVLPGTKMPTFQWDKMAVGPGAKGDGETKIQAVKDALFNLDRFDSNLLQSASKKN
ncbi:MAG: c-type cytochrome, partial [Planctomycetota bacterium]